MFEDPLLVAAVLCTNLLISEVLVQRTFCRHLGTALVVILVTAVTANTGIIPAAESPVYDGVFKYVANLAIFWLLLRVNLRDILRAGIPMVGLFLLGCVGTTLGVLMGMWLVGGAASIGESYRAIGGMFVGTYTGGSVNFNALALHYKVAEQGDIYVGSMVVDNIMTTIWMVATIALPRLLQPLWPGKKRLRQDHSDDESVLDHDTESVSPVDVSVLFAAGLGTLWFAEFFAGFATRHGLPMPPILIVTTIALAAAQVPRVTRLKGARLLGMFAVYLFLAVIGAYCDLAALGDIGRLGVTLLLFVAVVVGVHGLIIFAGGAAAGADIDTVAVASQANIGGGATALALGRSLGRNDLVLPAILVGSLGTALGNYLGWATAEFLL